LSVLEYANIFQPILFRTE